MAKSTHAQGDSYTAEELADPTPPFRITRAQVGKVDQPLVGISSIPSCENEESSSKSMIPESQPPVRTMGNLSDPPEMEGSFTAHSTVGDSQETPVPQSGKTSKKATPPKPRGTARVRTTDISEFDE